MSEQAEATAERPDIAALLSGHVENAEMGRRYGVTRHKTDAGNAERVVDAFSDVVRYDHAAGAWFWWTGKRWAADDRGIAMHLARTVVRSIYSEATRAEDQAERKALAEWAKRSEQANRLRAMLDLARSDPTVAVTSAVFDQEPDILNVENGIVNLKTGELLEHDPSRMCSKLAPVAFRPELLERDAEAMPGYVAAGPTFAAFVAEIMLGRRDAVEYLQRLFGYGATGHAREQILAIFSGSGANGKGTLLRVVKAALGDYAQSSPPSLIIQDDRNAGGASPEVARLQAVRLLEIEETDDGDRLHESKVKWLTGQDTLVARHLFRDYFEFQPQFTPVLVTNHRPRIANGGYALWRRLRLVPFDFTAEEEDATLEDRLKEELESVLAWIVEGSRLWFQYGMPDSETVEGASSRYRAEEDRVQPFITECTLTTGEIRKAELYRGYQRWAESEGERPLGAKRFHTAMREAGFEEQPGRKYDGISLKSEWRSA